MTRSCQFNSKITLKTCKFCASVKKTRIFLKLSSYLQRLYVESSRLLHVQVSSVSYIFPQSSDERDSFKLAALPDKERESDVWGVKWELFVLSLFVYYILRILLKISKAVWGAVARVPAGCGVLRTAGSGAPLRRSLFLQGARETSRPPSKLNRPSNCRQRRIKLPGGIVKIKVVTPSTHASLLLFCFCLFLWDVIVLNNVGITSFTQVL